MLYDDPQEMVLLTELWREYLAPLKAKLQLRVPEKAVSFLTGWELLALEENLEKIRFDNISYYPPETELPEYKLTVRVEGRVYELSKFPFVQQWYVGAEKFAAFFAITVEQALFLGEVIEGFEILSVLDQIRTEARLESLRKKYLAKPLQVKDLVLDQRGNAFLILQDDTKVLLPDAK